MASCRRNVLLYCAYYSFRPERVSSESVLAEAASVDPRHNDFDPQHIVSSLRLPTFAIIRLGIRSAAVVACQLEEWHHGLRLPSARSSDECDGGGAIVIQEYTEGR